MTFWLPETLIWTGALIALVLVLRRPVARLFGPGIAYALWVLPMARLMLPPITLPAWLAPGPPANTPPQELPGEVALPDSAGASGLEPVAGLRVPADEAPAPLIGFDLVDYETLIAGAFALWLGGAAVFMFVRFRAYFVLRARLLQSAREVGRVAGRRSDIRLLETPGTQAPLAFGVTDPVIALPEGFMAQPDRTARDLALEHELAHHRAGDLLVNVLVQPLFALHWFNPLGRYGWLALRRDQEAACDARVMAARGREERAAYARLITGFAAGPNVALAAPMACPVLGEKSIIHRLRSLKMTDMSLRRRMAGRMALGAAIIALPLTASITYAESAAPAAPEAPDAPASPAAPQAPAAPPAPDAPPAPTVPDAPPAPEGIEAVDPDTGEPQVRYEEESQFVYVIEREEEGEDGKSRKVVVERVVDGDGNVVSEDVRAARLGTRTEVIRSMRAPDGMSDAEIERLTAEIRRELKEADKVLRDVPATIERALDEARESGAFSRHRTVVELECDTTSDEVATTTTDDDGMTTVKLCQPRVMEQALKGIKEARRSIANNREMADSIRKRVLSELDRQIAEWENAAS